MLQQRRITGRIKKITMITFEEGTISEEQLREITKNYLGIRYRTNKDGSFEAYANVFTIGKDIFKTIWRKML